MIDLKLNINLPLETGLLSIGTPQNNPAEPLFAVCAAKRFPPPPDGLAGDDDAPKRCAFAGRAIFGFAACVDSPNPIDDAPILLFAACAVFGLEDAPDSPNPIDAAPIFVVFLCAVLLEAGAVDSPNPIDAAPIFVVFLCAVLLEAGAVDSPNPIDDDPIFVDLAWDTVDLVEEAPSPSEDIFDVPI